MKKITLPLISDTFLCVFICFFVAFTCLRYYTKNLIISAICGGVFAILCGSIAFLCIRRKLGKSYMRKSDERRRHLLAMHLSLSKPEYILSCYQSILEGAQRDGDTLTRFGERHYFLFQLSKLTGDEIARYVKTNTPYKKVLHCNYVEDDAKQLAEAFGIDVKTIIDAYISFNEHNLMPAKFAYEKTDKRSLWNVVTSSFQRNLYKKLFLYGVGLLFLSYFTFFPVYYMICGGGMLFFSLMCLLFGKRA